MKRIIESLQDEYRSIEKLLLVLEQELGIFARCERPDYEIVRGIISYFQDYPTRCHHPKEVLIFDKLKRRDPSAARMIGDFEAEHREEAARLTNFAQLVESIRTDHDLARRVFISAGRGFIDNQRQHIEREERLLFPTAVKSLQSEDWAEIDRQLNDWTNPLFNGKIEEKFRSMRDCLLQWERDNELERASTQ
jgi:hemerythrin-like domain-containing protein